MKEKRQIWLPVLLMFVFALTRVPGLMPVNFSAAYALVFCCGVYLPGRLAWWLPLTTLFLSDILLNVFYYEVSAVEAYMVVNYLMFAVILGMGRLFKPGASFWGLLGGGILGAILFYLVTNSISWLQNPQYDRSLAGWIQAMSTGIPGYPPTWTFFRNTLISGGLFTGLFVGAMKWSEAREPEEEQEESEEDESPGEAQPEEGKA